MGARWVVRAVVSVYLPSYSEPPQPFQAEQAEVKKRCIQAEPRHGELWQSVSKDVKNWRMRTEEILEATARLVEIPK